MERAALLRSDISICLQSLQIELTTLLRSRLFKINTYFPSLRLSMTKSTKPEHYTSEEKHGETPQSTSNQHMDTPELGKLFKSFSDEPGIDGLASKFANVKWLHYWPLFRPKTPEASRPNYYFIILISIKLEDDYWFYITDVIRISVITKIIYIKI